MGVAEDKFRFFRAWVANPLRVAAITPSGSALARLMVRDLLPANGPVVELGPGTGVFTRALLERGFTESDLILVEKDPRFAAMLRHRFPAASVICTDASHLNLVDIEHDTPLASVVSSLPLLSMPPRRVMAIMSGAFGLMPGNGAFYQFTYGPRCPVPRPVLSRLDLEGVQVGRTIRNIPPAAVYRIRKRQSANRAQPTNQNAAD